MRILFIAPEIPWPLTKGTCQRSYALLTALAQSNAVTLSTPVDDRYEARLKGIEALIEDFIPVPQIAKERETLPRTGGRVTRLRHYFADLVQSRVPYTFRMKSDVWAATITPLAGDFDLFFCRYSYLTLVFKNIDDQKILVDADDLQFMRLLRKAVIRESGWESVLIGIEALRSYRYEKTLCNRYLQMFVCSDLDRKKLGRKGVTVVRNGVELPDASRLSIPYQPNTLLFLGAFTYDANVKGLEWFCENVWPLVHGQNSAATLKVAGYGASESTLSIVNRPGIDVLGEVDDPRRTIIESMMMVVPLQFGTGSRVKIAEALGCGRTVIATSVGAEGYEDFGEYDGIYRADDPGKMARIILEFLSDPSKCMRAGANGRALAERRLAWDVTTSCLQRNVLSW